MHILAISDFVRSEILELYPVEPEKVLSTGNGYNQETFYPRKVNRRKLLADFNLDVPDHAPVVTFTGKVSKTKGVDTLPTPTPQRLRSSECCSIMLKPGQ